MRKRKTLLARPALVAQLLVPLLLIVKFVKHQWFWPAINSIAPNRKYFSGAYFCYFKRNKKVSNFKKCHTANHP